MATCIASNAPTPSVPVGRSYNAGPAAARNSSAYGSSKMRSGRWVSSARVRAALSAVFVAPLNESTATGYVRGSPVDLGGVGVTMSGIVVTRVSWLCGGCHAGGAAAVGFSGYGLVGAGGGIFDVRGSDELP